MKLRSPILIRLVAFLGALLIRCWMATVRYRIVSVDGSQHPADPKSQRYIYAFWHDVMLFPAVVPIKIQVLISQHADGELIAQICRYLDKGAVRGSSRRGGGQALLQMLRGHRDFHFAITPDGPRGPRRRLQPGIILLASTSGLPIVCCGIGFSKTWRMKSWDRFAVPYPWSSGICILPPAIHVPPNLNREGLEQHRCLVENQLFRATEAAENWATRGIKPTFEQFRQAA